MFLLRSDTRLATAQTVSILKTTNISIQCVNETSGFEATDGGDFVLEGTFDGVWS